MQPPPMAADNLDPDAIAPLEIPVGKDAFNFLIDLYSHQLEQARAGRLPSRLERAQFLLLLRQWCGPMALIESAQKKRAAADAAIRAAAEADAEEAALRAMTGDLDVNGEAP
jgi:hypothetical protein